MDRLPRSGSRHVTPPAGNHHPPLLTRCKSANTTTSPPLATILSNNPTTFTKSRSISTTKTRSYREPEVNHFMIHIPNPMTTNTGHLTSAASKKKPTKDSSTKILPRKKPTSPSAWALSPGRVAPCPSLSPSPVSVKPPSHGGRTTAGGLGGVLKYFRQKKSVTSEDAYVHSFKLMNNRLLQWRFANARAEFTMSAVKAVAELKMFNVWLEILAIRNSNMVKRMEVQKLKNQIRLYHIMNSQMFLLEKWSRIEGKNFEAVSRVVRKLTVACANIPLLYDSKGDVSSVCEVLDTANTLLSNIESAISKLSYQAEKSCYQLTELSIIAKQEHELLAELQTWMTDVALLKVSNQLFNDIKNNCQRMCFLISNIV
ncbi:putative QWRF family protein [Helianthus annuus]|nr:putative QWRF family protein [Helianthus annuus]